MKFNKVFIFISIMILSMITLGGCNKKDEAQVFVDKYIKDLNECNYEGIYENISKKSKESISKEIFVERYTKIYSGIGASNIKVDRKDTSNKLKPVVSLSMNSIGGNLKFDEIKLNIVKEDGEYKIVWDESLILPQMIKDDKIRVKTTSATRGKILDRDGNLLAYDGEANSIYIHPRIFEENKEENVEKISKILDKSKEYILSKIDNKNLEHLIPIVKISNYDQEKVDLLSSINGVTIKKENSRVYAQGEAFGNLIGYIGDINKEELEKNKDKGYTVYSKIGRQGLEQVYEEKLRARDGVHIYIERSSEEITIAKTEPINGEDIKLSIDSELQKSIYSQLNNEKGASVAIDPKTGEVLAMVSSPSYDSNTLVTYKTDTIDSLWEKNENTQFNNRANDAYSPGSTMKLITASIGLENGIINSSEAMDIKGLNWQKDSTWGSYKITRVKDIGKPVNLYDAIKYSDNIYIGDKTIKIGEEKYLEGISKFGIGEEVPFEYPMAKSQISNNGKLEKEILLADTGYGQGEVLMTPLDITMAYSALGNEGKIMVPRLVISENIDAKIYKEAIDSKYIGELTKCFSAVINDADGSGKSAKIENINLAGKTGTAEIKKSKDDESGTENGWFVAVDTDTSKIAISMIIEDVKHKSGSEYVVPKVKNVIENYIK